MEITSQTKLTDIIDKYPWLPDELVKIDSRLSIIKTPIGKMMIKGMTVADAKKYTDMSEEDMIGKFNKLVEAHK